MKTIFNSLLLLLTLAGYSQGNNHATQDYSKFKDLALTPPMGWNTFNTFAGNFDENLIREMADIMVSSGLRDAGYEYIIIDDNWGLVNAIVWGF